MSGEVRALHLAGRKLFLGRTAELLDAPPLFVVARYNVERRERIVGQIYGAPSAAELCRLASANGIDFIEVPVAANENPILVETWGRGGFATTADDGRPIRFLDVRLACDTAASAPKRSARN